MQINLRIVWEFYVYLLLIQFTKKQKIHWIWWIRLPCGNKTLKNKEYSWDGYGILMDTVHVTIYKHLAMCRMQSVQIHIHKILWVSNPGSSTIYGGALLLQGKVSVCQWKTTDLSSLNNTQLPAIPLSLFHVFLYIVMAAQFCYNISLTVLHITDPASSPY